MTIFERVDQLEANAGLPLPAVIVVTLIGVLAVATCIVVAFHNHDLNELQADLDEAGGDSPERLPGRLTHIEADVTELKHAMTDVIGALQDMAAREQAAQFVGNAVALEGDTEPVPTSPPTAPQPAVRPVPQAPTRVAHPRPVPGPRTVPTGDAIEQGKRDLTDTTTATGRHRAQQEQT